MSQLANSIDNTFQFLHTADIHLDSPMRGLAQYEGVTVDRIRSATRDAFVALVDRIVDARPGFAIIAGDLYDGDWNDFNTGLFFVDQMRKLRLHGIRVYVLYGNHDAHSQITKRLILPDNVHEFSHKKVQTHIVEEHDVALHGRSYPKRDVNENLSRDYPDPNSGNFNIGVLHTGLGGMGGHANYAPCSLDELVNKGYDYWALGHVHTRQILHEHPHVVFPGNLQGRHINEGGPRGASLVTVDHGKVDSIEAWECDVVRWQRLDVSVEGLESYDQVTAAVGECLTDVVAANDTNRVTAVRLQLTGATPLHGRLIASTDAHTENIQALSLDVGGDALWVEKVDVQTRPLASDAPDFSADEAFADLRQLLGASAKDPELIKLMAIEFSDMVSKIPNALKSDMEVSEGSFSQLIMEERHDELLARVLERASYELAGESSNES